MAVEAGLDDRSGDLTGPMAVNVGASSPSIASPFTGRGPSGDAQPRSQEVEGGIVAGHEDEHRRR